MNKRITLLVCVAVAFVTAHGVAVVEDTVDETYSLGAEPTISIANKDGSIRVYAANVTEVHLHAVKRAYSSERLESIRVDAKAEGSSLTIDTRYPAQPAGLSFADRSGTVEYTLVVPMTARIARCDLNAGELLIEGLQGGSAKAHLVNGWLAVHNCFVDADASIVNGKLDIAYDWWQSAKSFTVNAQSVNAGVRALIPPDGAVAINAEAQSGRVANNFSDEVPGQIVRSISTVIGAGDAQLNLRSTAGDIRIDKSY